MEGLKLLSLFLGHPAPVGLTFLGLVVGMVIGGLFELLLGGMLVGAVIGLAVGTALEIRSLVKRGG